MSFLQPAYIWFKIIHLIFLFAWIAGMMYLPRLYIYHFQAKKMGQDTVLFKTMEHRLLKGIMLPSIVGIWLFGILMVLANPDWLSAGWFHIKIFLALILAGIHGFYSWAQRQFAKDHLVKTARFWRIVNEIPFIGLIFIIILVVWKPF